MSKFCEPMVSTKVVNPTAARQAYRWIDNGVIELEPGQETVLPFELSTATPADNRYLIEDDLKEKRVQLEYLIRGIPARQVNSLPTREMTSEAQVTDQPPLFGTEENPYDAEADRKRAEQPVPADDKGVQQKVPARASINFMNNDVVQVAPDQANPTAIPGQRVKTFREVMGWPKQEAQRVGEAVPLQSAWAARVGQPKA